MNVPPPPHTHTHTRTHASTYVHNNNNNSNNKTGKQVNKNQSPGSIPSGYFCHLRLVSWEQVAKRLFLPFKTGFMGTGHI